MVVAVFSKWKCGFRGFVLASRSSPRHSSPNTHSQPVVWGRYLEELLKICGTVVIGAGLRFYAVLMELRKSALVLTLLRRSRSSSMASVGES